MGTIKKERASIHHNNPQPEVFGCQRPNYPQLIQSLKGIDDLFPKHQLFSIYSSKFWSATTNGYLMLFIHTSNFPPCRILGPQNPSLISDPKYCQSEEAAPIPDFSPSVLFEMIIYHRCWGLFPHKQSQLAHAPTLNCCCFFPSMRHSSQSLWHVSCPSTVEQQT